MVLKPNEDLFEDTRMSFGEHLEELRRVLIKSLIGLGLGFGIALLLASRIILFLQGPLEKAIADFSRQQAIEDIKRRNDGFVPPEVMPLLDQDRLIPRRLKLEPRELFAVLREEYPDLEVGTPRSPHAFRPSQLTLERTTELAARLTAETPDENPGAQWLKDRLSPEQRQSLVAIAGKASATRDDRTALLTVLDALSTEPTLYDDPAFEDVFSGVEDQSTWTKWIDRVRNFFASESFDPLGDLREQVRESKDPDETRRLNRLVITSTLARQVDAVRIDLTEIEVWEATKVNTQALKVEETFMVWLKAALIAGIVISSPWIFLQLWTFVAAGLYPHERRYVYMYMPISITLFLSGVALAFFGVFEPVLMFLFQFNASMGIDPQPRIGEWLSFVMILPLGFGIAFQLPVVMLFLNRIGLFSMESYLEKWRIAILVIFFLSMILTPADPISMILLAAPLSVLYFGGILLCRWMPRNRNPFAEAYEP